MSDISKLVQMAEEIEKHRADKVARFLEMVSDPELASIVSLIRNGHHPEQKNSNFVPPHGFKSGNGIRDAIRDLSLPEEFTADDIVRGLEEANFNFVSEERKAPAVRDALRALAARKEFRIKRRGKGGRLSVYERASHSSRSAGLRELVIEILRQSKQPLGPQEIVQLAMSQGCEFKSARHGLGNVTSVLSRNKGKGIYKLPDGRWAAVMA